MATTPFLLSQMMLVFHTDTAMALVALIRSPAPVSTVQAVREDLGFLAQADQVCTVQIWEEAGLQRLDRQLLLQFLVAPVYLEPRQLSLHTDRELQVRALATAGQWACLDLESPTLVLVACGLVALAHLDSQGQVQYIFRVLYPLLHHSVLVAVPCLQALGLVHEQVDQVAADLCKRKPTLHPECDVLLGTY